MTNDRCQTRFSSFRHSSFVLRHGRATGHNILLPLVAVALCFDATNRFSERHAAEQGRVADGAVGLLAVRFADGDRRLACRFLL
jgi:hypothetical protein